MGYTRFAQIVSDMELIDFAESGIKFPHIVHCPATRVSCNAINVTGIEAQLFRRLHAAHIQEHQTSPQEPKWLGQELKL